MQAQQVEQFLRAMFSWHFLESERVMEDSAPDHDAVDAVFIRQFLAGFAVWDISVNGD